MTAESKDLIPFPAATVRPAVIAVDFSSLERDIDQHLAQYSGVVVTKETIPGARALAAELNKTLKIIEDKRKELKREAMVPIDAFDKEMRRLIDKIFAGRASIASQVMAFDEERRKKAIHEVTIKIREYAAELADRFKLEPSFRQGLELDQFCQPSSLTAGGELTQAAVMAIELYVAKTKVAQDRKHERIQMIDAANAEHSLEPPLTERDFGVVISLPGDQWAREFARVISVRTKIREAAEKAAKESAEKASVEKPAQHSTEVPVEQPGIVPRVGEDGKIECLVCASFKIRVKPGVQHKAIISAVRAGLERAGFSNIIDIG